MEDVALTDDVSVRATSWGAEPAWAAQHCQSYNRLDTSRVKHLDFVFF